MATVLDLSGNGPQIIDNHIPWPNEGYGGVQVALQDITTGAASVQSNPFTNRTQAIRIGCKTAAVRYRCGPAPQVAVATDPIIAAAQIEGPIFVRPGWVIAAIQDTGAGELTITEIG